MNILETCTSPKTVREISEALGKSETWVRDSLKLFVVNGQIIRDGTVKPATFTTKPELEPDKDDLDAELGLNEPKVKKAKVSINPQPALDKMVKDAAEAGQTMTYDRQTRTWTIGSRKVLARDLPALRTSGFKAWLARGTETYRPSGFKAWLGYSN